MTPADAIVIGSGASGTQAAVPLVEAGLDVVMLDVGHEDLGYERLVPRATFVEVRKSDASQHRYFLGDRLEGIQVDASEAGPQITPPRSYVLKGSDELAPKKARNFHPLESFALGGLGRAWGAVAFPFLDGELSRCGIAADELREHYEIVARRIGISGHSRDCLSEVRGPLGALQSPLLLDHNAEAILSRYDRMRDRLRHAGLYLGQSLLAVLSEPLGGREPNDYTDMDFWSNHGESVYRPNITLRHLQTYPNFAYRPRFLVSEFSERNGVVNVIGRDLDRRGQEMLAAKFLLVAAGSLGTTRLVLRSLAMYDHPVPLVCNAHTYMPCLHYRGLNLTHADRCHSLAQLTLIYDPTLDREHLVQAQMYSYRSLQLFRLLRETPLAHREGIRIMQALAPHVVIWVIQHEDVPTRRKWCALKRGSSPEEPILEMEYGESEEERAHRDQHELSIARLVRRLGCLPLKRIHSAHGSSVHYAGQFPMTRDERPLTTEPSGRLRGTRAVYLADGSTLAYLPAKGPTLTLMANANRVGVRVLQSLRP